LLKQRFEHGSGVVTLRAAAPADEPFLARLYASTREEELRQTGWTDEQKAAFCASQFQLQQVDYAATYPAEGHQIIVRDDLPIGRVWIAERTDCLFIVDMALLPEFRSSGIGTMLLEEIFAEADGAGLPVRLTVLWNNPRAIALCERLGFRAHDKDEMLIVLERPASASG
jgi:GNAT superfamily N-acetyltransferase